jgi:hypothetical protein
MAILVERLGVESSVPIAREKPVSRDLLAGIGAESKSRAA